MGQSPTLWQATYEAQTNAELNDAYRKWAGLYDRDTREVMGYGGDKNG